MTGKVNINGTWRTVSGVNVKVGNSWRTVSQGFVKVGTTWRLWFAALISDTFTRADTTTGLGTADSGQPWTALRGNWFVKTGAATTTDNPSTYPIATQSIGQGATSVTQTIDSVGDGTGLVLWATDSGNWFAVTSSQSSTTCNCSTCNNGYQTCNSNPCGNNGYCNSSVCGTNAGTPYYSGCNSPYQTCNHDICGNNAYQVCNIAYYNTGYCCYGCGAGGGYGCSSSTPNYYCAFFSNPYYSGCNSCSSAWYNSVCGTNAGTPYYSGCNSCYTGTTYYAGCNSCTFVPGTTYSCNCQTCYPVVVTVLQSAANVVSQLTSWAISTVASAFSVNAKHDGTITTKVYSDKLVTQIGSDLIYTATGASVSTIYGIVLSPSSYNQGTSLDDYSATPQY